HAAIVALGRASRMCRMSFRRTMTSGTPGCSGPCLQSAMQNARWLNIAAVATWVLSGIYPLGILLDRPLTWWPSAAWLAAYLTNGAAMTLLLMLPRMARGALPGHL